MQNPEDIHINEHEEINSLNEGTDQPQLEPAPMMSILPPASQSPQYVEIPETPEEIERREEKERRQQSLASIDEIEDLEQAKTRLRGLTADFHGEMSRKADEGRDSKYEKTIATKDVEIGALKAENTRLQSVVKAEQGKVKPLQDEITRLQGELANLRATNQNSANLSAENQTLRDEKSKTEKTIKRLQYALSTSLVVMSLALGGVAGKTLIDARTGGERAPTEASSSGVPPKSLEEALGMSESQEVKPLPAPEWYEGRLNKVAPIAEGQKADDRYEVMTKTGALYVTDVGIRYGDATHYRFVGPEGKLYDLVVPDSNEGVSFSEIISVE